MSVFTILWLIFVGIGLSGASSIFGTWCISSLLGLSISTCLYVVEYTLSGLGLLLGFIFYLISCSRRVA